LKLNKNKVPDECQPPNNYKQLIDKQRIDKFVNINDVANDEENEYQNNNEIKDSEKDKKSKSKQSVNDEEKDKI